MPDKDETDRKEREEEIKARARRVYEISFDYHLTHAVFGGNNLLYLDLQDAHKGEYTKIKDAMLEAARKRDNVRYNKLLAEKKGLDAEIASKKQHVLIDYVNISDKEAGRAIKAEKKLVITLPKKLTENLKDDAGNLQKEVVAKIREKMAHELGHIVLHTDLLQPGTNGSNELNDDLDWEATVFAVELLRLYDLRDHHIDKPYSSSSL